MIIGACIVAQVPLLHTPFSWMQTFFHEISHGLIAIITGGEIISIQLNLDGSGLCVSRGGWLFLITISGYFGAILWGALIHIIVSAMKDKNAFLIALLIIGLISISLLLWVRDFTTFLVLGITLIPFIIALRSRSYLIERYFLQFSGIYILLDAIKTPINLLFIQNRGDDAALADMTGIPQIFWVCLWMGTGLLTLWCLYKIQNKRI